MKEGLTLFNTALEDQRREYRCSDRHKASHECSGGTGAEDIEGGLKSSLVGNGVR